jgi:hypothetical protein
VTCSALADARSALEQGAPRRSSGPASPGRDPRSAAGQVVTRRRLLWDGDRILQEDLLDADGGVAANIARNGNPRQYQLGAAVTRYATLDHFGSVRDITDPSGALLAAFSYDT